MKDILTDHQIKNLKENFDLSKFIILVASHSSQKVYTRKFLQKNKDSIINKKIIENN